MRNLATSPAIFLCCSLPIPALVAAQDAGNLEEVVVTAQKRAEKLEDVPVAITTLSGAQLESAGVDNIQQLGQVTPGLLITRNSAQSAPVIRGITSTLAGPGSDAAVATYVDGFFQPSKTANIFDFNNIQSVQVLKGPQGTLFGRNATGGALLITTAEPSFNPTAKISASYRRFDDMRINTYVSGGLTDSLASDLALYYKESDGYIEDFATGDPTAQVEQLNVRTKTVFEASDRVKFVFTYEHSEIDDPTPLVYLMKHGLGSVVYPGIAFATQPYTSSLTDPVVYKVESDAAYLKTQIDLGFAELTSYTGYHDQNDLFDGELSGYPRPVLSGHFEQPQRTFTQEINLGGETGALNWVTGLFYLHDKTAYEDFSVNNAPPHGSDVVTDAYAAFADGTYQLTDRFALSLGLRYSWEERKFVYGVPADGAMYIDTDKSWDSLTPRVIVRYELADRTNVYASFSKGFKSGSFNASSFAPEPVDPEEVDAFEIGFKTAAQFWRFDTSAFYYDYSNLQVFISNFATGGANSILINAAEAEIYGADAQLTAQLSDQLSVNVGAAWTHARYDSFPSALDYCPTRDTNLGTPAKGCETQPPTGTPANPGPDVLRQVFIDASGNRMPRSPDFTFNLGADYVVPTSVGNIGLGGNAAYRSSVVFSPGERLEQDGYALLNLRLWWQTVDERWKVTLFGNNVTDETYLINSQSNTLGDGEIYGEPAVYGITLSANFE